MHHLKQLAESFLDILDPILGLELLVLCILQAFLLQLMLKGSDPSLKLRFLAILDEL